MASLNVHADTVLIRLNLPMNEMFRDAAKRLLKNWRATLIRRQDERTPLPSSYYQFVKVEMVKADKTLDCTVSSGCYLLKSTTRVPRAINTKDYGLYGSVSTLDSKVKFTHTPLHNWEEVSHNRWGVGIRYDIHNDYLILLLPKGYARLKWVKVRSLFEEPEEANQVCGSGDCYNDDMEFPMDLDMANRAIDAITKNDFAHLRGTGDEDKEIKLDDKESGYRG